MLFIFGIRRTGQLAVERQPLDRPCHERYKRQSWRAIQSDTKKRGKFQGRSVLTSSSSLSKDTRRMNWRHYTNRPQRRPSGSHFNGLVILPLKRHIFNKLETLCGHCSLKIFIRQTIIYRYINGKNELWNGYFDDKSFLYTKKESRRKSILRCCRLEASYELSSFINSIGYFACNIKNWHISIFTSLISLNPGAFRFDKLVLICFINESSAASQVLINSPN